jgi:hypothetical protein
VVEEFGFASIEVEKMAKLPVRNLDDKGALPELRIQQGYNPFEQAGSSAPS